MHIMMSSKSPVEPVGWKEFAEILCKTNVPLPLIVNPKRLRYISEKNVGEIEEEEVKPSTSELYVVEETPSKSSKSLRKRTRKRFYWSPYRVK